MNDFNKSELSEIWESLDVERLQNGNGEYSRLMIKIQRMISSYKESEMERKNRIYADHILPMYGNNPDNVPPHLEPDFNEGWR